MKMILGAPGIGKSGITLHSNQEIIVTKAVDPFTLSVIEAILFGNQEEQESLPNEFRGIPTRRDD